MRIALRTTDAHNVSYGEIGSRFSARFGGDADSSAAVITNRVAEALTVAESGKHVLVDTPGDLNSADCALLAAAGALSGVIVMPGHAWRFVPSIATVQSRLAAGNLGDPGLLRIHRWKSQSGEQAGRALLLADIDLAVWTFGKRPNAIYTVRRSGYLQVHLGFDGDGMAILDHSFGRPANTNYDSLTLIGSAGAAYADDHHNMNLHLGADGTKAICTGQSNVHLVNMVKEFLAAITESRAPSVSLTDTVEALQTVDALFEGEGRIL